MPLWTPSEIPIDEPTVRRVGPLGLWLCRTAFEWQVGQDRAPTSGPPEADAQAEPPADMNWERWALDGDSRRVRLSPAMPDRPLVVRPEHDLLITPASTCVFYVNVAAWVRISVGPEGQETRLVDVPTVQLSNTWFGDPTEGELCYSVRTKARRALLDLAPQPHRVVCRIAIRNESDEPLDLERICLRVTHMGIYADSTRLWATPCELAYRGGDRFSRVDYREGPPDESDHAVLLTPPTSVPEAGVINRSIGRLRDLLQHRVF